MSDEGFDHETAFSLLADETRVRIVEELGHATVSPDAGIPHLTYADLKSRVDVRDSGRFNYHLTKLLGNYVAKGDAGYRLRWPGMVLYRALVAGLLTSDADLSIDRFPTGTDCHRCGDPVEAHLYETLFRVRCWSCDANYADIYVPAQGLVDETPKERLRTVHRRSRTVLDAMTAGQCPWCANAVAVEVHAGDGSLPSLHDTRDLDAYAILRCTNCTGFHYLPVSQVLLYHPATIAFYHDHGVDLSAIPKWELRWAVTDATTEVRGTDPWRFTVRVPLDDDVLVAEIDDDLDVTATRVEEKRR
ncbi:hypothetical protein G9C85_04470 [Halorubellus sp. JP-L1]|uniref:DUF7351 domain-containing protein n=1 Tax=Halorubellus sp. JP-L1 TaxID=2715753 RepID=UPI00140C28B6|nr:hypothetical protein [Halorubellus sp. JP-L1]NHN40889.1 hypothetical protein [Halorubellus sp. JP-L1]